MAAYHEEQLLLLLERVRDGFRRLDAGEIDAFELDDLIHRYKRSARELWKFCGSSGSGWERAAGTLKYLREQVKSYRIGGRRANRGATTKDRPTRSSCGGLVQLDERERRAA